MKRKIAILSLLGLLTLVIDYLAERRNGYFDSKVYYGAMDYWVNRGGDIYDYLVPGTEYGFTYPPFAAALMSPMALISWNTAVAIRQAAHCHIESLRGPISAHMELDILPPT